MIVPSFKSAIIKTFKKEREVFFLVSVRGFMMYIEQPYHKWRKVKLERKRHDREAHNNTDRNCTSVDRIIPHPLEDDARLPDRMDDCRQSRSFFVPNRQFPS
jgi:hypothetical protein